jgi:hypothetical protein
MRLPGFSSLDITKKKKKCHSRNRDSEYWIIGLALVVPVYTSCVLRSALRFFYKSSSYLSKKKKKVKSEEKILATHDQQSQKHFLLIISQYF